MPDTTVISGVFCALLVRLDGIGGAWTLLGQRLDSAWTMLWGLEGCLEECLWSQQRVQPYTVHGDVVEAFVQLLFGRAKR